MTTADQEQKKMPPCEMIIFTATTTEKETLEEAAKALGFQWEEIDNPFFEAVSLGEAGGSRIISIHTSIGVFGGNGSAANAVLAKNLTGATTLIAVGMAFGVDRTAQKVGDVLVSTSLLTYDDRIVRRNADGAMFTDYPDRRPYLQRIFYPANPVAVAQLEAAVERGVPQKVHFGSLLTGGCAVQCAAYRDDLSHHLAQVLRKRTKRVDEGIVGGEMEGSGFLATCGWADPCWVIVKAISDFGDESRAMASKEEVSANRDLACGNSIEFVLRALRDFQPKAP